MSKIKSILIKVLGLPDGSVVKTLSSPCGGTGSIPWSRNLRSHMLLTVAPKKTLHGCFWLENPCSVQGKKSGLCNTSLYRDNQFGDLDVSSDFSEHNSFSEQRWDHPSALSVTAFHSSSQVRALQGHGVTSQVQLPAAYPTNPLTNSLGSPFVFTTYPSHLLLSIWGGVAAE